jgi:DNA-binding transcriptional MerR regulator
MTKKTFSPKEVSKLANISARQLGYWKLIGIVRPGQEMHGTRLFYRYSEADLELLKAVQKMTEQGYLVSKAADKIKAALARGEEVSVQTLFNLISPQPVTHPDISQAITKGMEAIQKRIEEELIRSRRFKYSVSCLAIRVEVSPSDNEDVIRQMTQRIQTTLSSYKRAYDMIAQVDDQELLWLLCQTTAEGAQRLATRIHQMIPELEGANGPVRYSVQIHTGSATVDPSEDDGTDLVPRARASMSAAAFRDRDVS